MIAVAFAALLVQTLLQRDGPALLDQATTRIINSYGDMAEAMGRCSQVYPGGSAHPYVVKARQDVEGLGIDFLTIDAQRVESILYARASGQPADPSLSVTACSAQIEEPAEAVSLHVEGLRDLLVRLERENQPR